MKDNVKTLAGFLLVVLLLVGYGQWQRYETYRHKILSDARAGAVVQLLSQNTELLQERDELRKKVQELTTQLYAARDTHRGLPQPAAEKPPGD